MAEGGDLQRMLGYLESYLDDAFREPAWAGRSCQHGCPVGGVRGEAHCS